LGLPFLLQVANFEYVNEEDALAAAAVEEAEKEVKAKREAELAEGPGRVQFWDNLLKDRAVEVQVEEVQELGKGKRSRKQVHLVLVSHLFMLSFVLIVLCIFFQYLITKQLRILSQFSKPKKKLYPSCFPSELIDSIAASDLMRFRQMNSQNLTLKTLKLSKP
jgi:hypothetical protein